MKCLTPLTLAVPVTMPNGVKKFRYRDVPCGHCMACLKTKQQNWVTRLLLEKQVSSSCFFVTLTLETKDGIEPVDLDKSQLQKFVKRLRAHAEYHGDSVPIRYFAVGEYGERNYRPHYHLMIYNLPASNFVEAQKLIERSWPFGFVQVADCNEQLCNYICKYITKIDKRPHKVPPFVVSALDPDSVKKFIDTSIPKVYTESVATSSVDNSEVCMLKTDFGKLIEDYVNTSSVMSSLIFRSTGDFSISSNLGVFQTIEI